MAEALPFAKSTAPAKMAVATTALPAAEAPAPTLKNAVFAKFMTSPEDSVLCNENCVAAAAFVEFKAYDALVALAAFVEFKAYDALVALLAYEDDIVYDALVVLRA